MRLCSRPAPGTKVTPPLLYNMTGTVDDVVRQWADEACQRGVPVERCEDMARHQLADYVVASGGELRADPRWLLRVRWGPGCAVRLLTDAELGPLPPAERDDPCPACGSSDLVYDERGTPTTATCATAVIRSACLPPRTSSAAERGSAAGPRQATTSGRPARA
jgi:hypothetical protein